MTWWRFDERSTGRTVGVCWGETEIDGYRELKRNLGSVITIGPIETYEIARWDPQSWPLGYSSR